MDHHPLYRNGEFATKKPKPLDLSHHFSEVTKHRTPSQMKQYYRFFGIPGIGNLAGGKKPYPTYTSKHSMTY